MSKRILFVSSDTQQAATLQAANSGEWECLAVATGAEALTLLEAQAVDVLVVDFHLCDMESNLFMVSVSERFPKALRLLTADPDEMELVIRNVQVQHYFLPQPISPELLLDTVNRALALDSALTNDSLRSLTARLRSLPSLPTLYFQVMKELSSPDFSAQKVGEIIGKDMAMSTRLLQVLNSGFYSLPRQITDPSEAVSMMGQETIESLILSIHVFATYDKIKPLYFSISQVWKHSTAVANAARKIALLETNDSDLGDEAYTAGLLHDIGKLVLALNIEAEYNQIQEQARTKSIPLWKAESETLGANHADLGAFLLGRWAMPVSVLEAAAMHHQPMKSAQRTFSVLTAVHVANALERERQPSGASLVPSELDLDYLRCLKLEHRLDAWRECLVVGSHNPSQLQDHSRTSPTRAATVTAEDKSPARTCLRWAITLTSLTLLGLAAWLGWNTWHNSTAPSADTSNTQPETNAVSDSSINTPPTNEIILPEATNSPTLTNSETNLASIDLTATTNPPTSTPLTSPANAMVLTNTVATPPPATRLIAPIGTPTNTVPGPTNR